MFHCPHGLIILVCKSKEVIGAYIDDIFDDFSSKPAGRQMSTKGDLILYDLAAKQTSGRPTSYIFFFVFNVLCCQHTRGKWLPNEWGLSIGEKYSEPWHCLQPDAPQVIDSMTPMLR